MTLPDVLLHQALHGYADGHRQISLSASLAPHDAKTLMTLSDSSGPGARFPDGGYLTGYPLVDSGYYVLARTWAAPEMPRPGCVWTHSLLIDFADLAILPEMAELLRFFRRPKEGDFSPFGTSFVCKSANTIGNTFEVPPSAERLLSALYGEPSAQVIASSDTAQSEALILRIWSQQWPRLKRNFRFCTYAATDRSTKAAPFDLQILPIASKAIRSRFINSLDVDEYHSFSSEWIKDTINDLAIPDCHGLRTFLRQVGGDISAGREAFNVLCRLHALLNRADTEEDAFGKAIELLESSFSTTEARAARLAIAKSAVRYVESLNEVGFDFLLRNLDNVGKPSAVELAKLGEAVWNRSPERLEQLLTSGSIGQTIVELTIERLPIASLAVHASEVPDLTKEMLARRPGIVAEPEFWSNLRGTFKPAFDCASTSELLASEAARAMIDARRVDLAREAISALGAYTIGRAVVRTDPYQLDSAWIRTVASKPELLAKLLSEEPPFHRYMLALLASTMEPDDLPNDVGQDPWLTAMVSSCGDISSEHESSLYAFLMARALGSRSMSSAELFVETFDAVYANLVDGNLASANWRSIERRLPWMVYDWNPCARLREAVLLACIDRGFPPMTINSLTSDNHIFEALVRTAASTVRGRKYIKRLLSEMIKSRNPQFATRVQLLDRLV